MGWVVSFTHRLLYTQGKSPQYPVERRLSGRQSQSRRGDKENPAPTDNLTLNPVCPAHNLVTVLAS
jgi:hypothetical protein